MEDVKRTLIILAVIVASVLWLIVGSLIMLVCAIVAAFGEFFSSIADDTGDVTIFIAESLTELSQRILR